MSPNKIPYDLIFISYNWRALMVEHICLSGFCWNGKGRKKPTKIQKSLKL